MGTVSEDLNMINVEFFELKRRIPPIEVMLGGVRTEEGKNGFRGDIRGLRKRKGNRTQRS